MAVHETATWCRPCRIRGVRGGGGHSRGTGRGAFQNVENELSGLRLLARQSDLLDAGVHEANQATMIVLNEYRASAVDYTTAATALSTRQRALNVRQQRLLDTVSLIGDLVGSWASSELDQPLPTCSAH